MAASIDPGANAAAAAAQAAAEAMRRAMEEAARRAAEAAAKQAALAAQAAQAKAAQMAQQAKVSQLPKPAPTPTPRPGMDSAPSSAATAKKMQLLGSPDAPPPSKSAPATTLLTENTKDGSRNCLDAVGDWLNMASPQIRARSEVLMLRDTRPGAEGQTGHVVIRQGDSILDPSTGKSYPSFAAFNAAGNYQIAGTIPGTAMQKILSTPPGSPERQAAIDRARIPPAVATMLVADNGSTGTRDVSAAFGLLKGTYAQTGNLTSAAQMALQSAQGDPAMQANLIALLQGTPADQLTQQLSQAAQPELQEPVPFQPPAPAQHVEVGGRVDGNALDAVIGSVSPQVMGPALAAAKNAGVLSQADIERGLLSPQLGNAWMSALTAGGINPLAGASVPQALAQVKEAQQAYQTALDQRAKLDQRLAADLKAFGPYLTPQQQQDYILKFRQDHASEYAPIDAAAQHLDQVLNANKAQLALAMTGADGAKNAGSVYAAYQSLANSPYAQDALNWALTADKAGSSFAPFAGQYDLNKVVQNAMPNSMAAYIQANPNVTPEQAFQHMDAVTTTYLAQQGFGSGSTVVKEWSAGIAALNLMAHGGSKVQVQAAVDAIKGLSPRVAGGFAAVGMIVGMASIAQGVSQGDWLKTAWAGAFTAQQTASAVDAAMKALGTSSALASKVIGGLTVVTNVLDVMGMLRDGVSNIGEGAQIAGDMVGVVGGLMMAGVLTGPGEIVAAAGAVLYVIGSVANTVIENQKVVDDQKKLLTAVGADADRIFEVWNNDLPPTHQLPTGGRGLTALLMAHDSSGTPIVFDKNDGQTLVFAGMSADGRIQYTNPFTGQSGSMSPDEFFSTVTSVHVPPEELAKWDDNYRPPTPHPQPQ